MSWRRCCAVARAAAGASVLGAGLAAKQAWELRCEWRGLRLQASACSGPQEGCEGAAGPRGARPLLLLFLGDSLVSGVGGQVSACPTPAALPRHVAAHLSEQLGEVRWASVGITGADVERLAAEGLPRLRELAQGAGTASVVVVLVVGVNDLRRLRLGYRLRLRRLVQEARQLGKVEGVFLPAVAIADAPMLQRYPLKLFVAPLCSLWEREKRKAISWCHDAQVLPFPAAPSGGTEAFFSADQMHPNLAGYEFWARGLAKEIARWRQQSQNRLEPSMPSPFQPFRDYKASL
mmetsp:Transcript_39021/g.72657  ORF Transcript_39021/g.72657 Transcript_39021/m.72657 type:complete len:291 (+) Transcript_39021:73-945(+)